ncbi:malate dehydrogenase (quinone) [Nocardioides panzhihuensis]|uniref:Probable malate:quinone oxidoreductase n=1 Tax=Nocardioides panzhihuensis TaxID=860243 RepID=A0A7Z0IVX4_9ACTN|nr:malate dehydrogenase (quinone) [Nocardioides panzhihuensis]NYI81228.1 malate dehydrogenase (quinone) [Nocardioides panzhihuensis]
MTHELNRAAAGQEAIDADIDADIVLVGGGIMSATLGSMLAVLEPDWKVILVERADALATESSGPWNNAGTGHSGYCELNYMPEATDDTKPTTIAQQFLVTREWWAYLADLGLLDPDLFIHSTPHMNVVFGEHDVTYLRQRFETLTKNPLFSRMEFSEDPATIAAWAPLLMAGREPGDRIAATRVADGTDVDFGALTRAMVQIIDQAGGEVRMGHDVRTLTREADGRWLVGGIRGGKPWTMRSRRVFIGAGGYALNLLQKAKVPEVRGYAVLPVGAAFLRSETPAVVGQHDGKVYSQARVGAPPMSVPHLDKRIVDGKGYLMFGPYATFSTKLLKHGRLSDVFRTLRWHNLHVIAAALVQNLSLVGYLIGELLARPRTKFDQLRRFYPDVDPSEWDLVPAGQRAQLVTPNKHRIGVLQQGTELVVGADGTVAGLVGASPGASTAVPIMLDLLKRWFPQCYVAEWRGTLTRAVPGQWTRWDDRAVESSLHSTAQSLNLNPVRSGP